MQDVTAALVPYTMFCGPFASTLAGIVHATGSVLERARMPVQYPRPATRLASARVRTSQYLWTQAAEGGPRSPADDAPAHTSVYNTVLAQERALASSADDAPRAAAMRQRRHDEMNAQLRDAAAAIKKQQWLVGPHAIVVRDGWYSQTALLAAGLFVLCALSLASFVAGETRVVDRPNLVVFVWTAAGLLVAHLKARRVADWPWPDFVRGRVVCRSVSQVAAAARVNPQTLLAILLHKQTQTRLELGGPFCALFRDSCRAPGGLGFDMDVAPLHDTAMAGGHLFVVVRTADGAALIDLAPRAGDDAYLAVPNAGSNVGDHALRDALYCINAHRPDRFLSYVREHDAASNTLKTRKLSLPMYRLSDGGVLVWTRVLGVLDERAIFR